MSTSSLNVSDASSPVGNNSNHPQIDYEMIFANVQQNAIAQLEALEAQERAHKSEESRRAKEDGSGERAPKRGRKRAQDAPNDAPKAPDDALKDSGRAQDAPDDAQAPGPPENALGASSAPKRGRKRASKDSGRAQDAPNDAQFPQTPEPAPKKIQDAPDDAQAPQPSEPAPGASSAPKRGQKRASKDLGEAQDAPNDAQAPGAPECAPKKIQDAPKAPQAPQPPEPAPEASSAPKKIQDAPDDPNDAPTTPQAPEPAPGAPKAPKKIQDAPKNPPKAPQAPTLPNPAPGAPRAPTPEEIEEELNWLNETARKSNSSPEQVEAAIREWFELTGIGAPENAQVSARGVQDLGACGEGAPSAPEAPEAALGAQDDPDDAPKVPQAPEAPENAPGAPSAEEIASELDWILETISRTNATPEQIMTAVEQWIENQSSGATDASNQAARGAQDLGASGQEAPAPILKNPAAEGAPKPEGNAPRALDPDRVFAPSSSLAAPRAPPLNLPMIERMGRYLAPAPALQIPDEGSTSPIIDVEGIDPVLHDPMVPALSSPGSMLQFFNLVADPDAPISDSPAPDPAHPGAPDDQDPPTDSGALESVEGSQELGYSETYSANFGTSATSEEQLGFSAILSESFEGSGNGRSEPLETHGASSGALEVAGTSPGTLGALGSTSQSPGAPDYSGEQIRALGTPRSTDFRAPGVFPEALGSSPGTPEAPALSGAHMGALGAPPSNDLGALGSSSGTPESSAPSPKIHRALGAPGAPSTSSDSSAPSGSNEQSSSALQDQEALLPNPQILRALGAPMVNRSASAPAPPLPALEPDLGSRINFSAPNLISFGMPALQESPRRRERARRAHRFEVSEAMPEKLREIIEKRRKNN